MDIEHTSKSARTRLETIAQTVRNIANDKASARAYLRRVVTSVRARLTQISRPGSAYENLALQLHAETLVLNCGAEIEAFLYQGGSKKEAREFLDSLFRDEV